MCDPLPFMEIDLKVVYSPGISLSTQALGGALRMKRTEDGRCCVDKKGRCKEQITPVPHAGQVMWGKEEAATSHSAGRLPTKARFLLPAAWRLRPEAASWNKEPPVKDLGGSDSQDPLPSAHTLLFRLAQVLRDRERGPYIYFL